MAIEVWKAGFCCLCPHLNSGGLEEEGIENWKFYLGDLHILQRCDAMLLIPGWKDSQGAKMEVRMAQELGVPVFESLEELKQSHFFSPKKTPALSTPFYSAGSFHTPCKLPGSSAGQTVGRTGIRSMTLLHGEFHTPHFNSIAKLGLNGEPLRRIGGGE